MGIAGLLILISAITTIASLAVLARWLWRKGRYGIMVVVVAVLELAWQVYDAVYPPESFYVSRLKYLVNVTLPSDAQFLSKTATYPDFHGDDSGCFVVHLSDKEVNTLKASLVPEQAKKSMGSASCEMGQPQNVWTDHYDLSERATQIQADVFIDLVPERNLAVIAWWTK